MAGSIEWIPVAAQVKPGSLGESLISEAPLLAIGERTRPVTTLDKPIQDLWPKNPKLVRTLGARGFTTTRNVLDLSEEEFSGLDRLLGIRGVMEGYVQGLAVLPQVLTLSRILKRSPLAVFPEHEHQVRDLIAFGLAQPVRGVRPNAKTELWKQVVIDHDGLDNGIQTPVPRLAKELGRTRRGVEDLLRKGIWAVGVALMNEFADDHDRYRKTLISWRVLPNRSVGRIALRQSFVRQLSQFRGAQMTLSDQQCSLIDGPLLNLGWQDSAIRRGQRDTAENFAMIHEGGAQDNSTTSVPLDGLLALDLCYLERDSFIQIMDAAEIAISNHRNPEKRAAQEVSRAFKERQYMIDITDEEIAEQRALGNKLIPEVVFGNEDFTFLSGLKLTQVIERLGRELDDVDDQGRPRRADIASAEWGEGLSRYSLYEVEDLLNRGGIETFGDLLTHSRPKLAEILDGRFNNEIKRIIWEVLAFPNQFDSSGDYFQNIARYMPSGQSLFSLFKNAEFIGEEIRSDFAIYGELQ